MDRNIFGVMISLVLLMLTGCATINDGTQYTNKVAAPNFVTELYGNTIQTVTISHPEGGHISWMGFVQSNDYKYFEITKVQAGTKMILSEGQEIDGELFSASSNAIVEDITLDNSKPKKTGYTNGSISMGDSNDLKISVRYSPLQAIASNDEPHEAYLIINYDEPKQGSLRIQLKGFTQGIKSEKCTQAISTMEVIEYQIKGGVFDLYFCSAEVAKAGQNNASDHGASTNLASITVTDPVVTFYQVDDETVCILTEPDPSVAPFVLPIPPGLAPIDSMDISLVEGSFAKCSLDASGNILCPANIQIDALVSVSGFTLTNQGFTAAELVTEQCPDFGAINGSGAFGDDGLTVLLSGRTLSDQNTQEYNIVDSLIMAVIQLEK